MSFDPEEILSACGAGSPDEGARFLVAADWFLSRGQNELAASALDRAYGLLPGDEDVARQRRAVLDDLAVEEHGLVFRYVPAGTFLMGANSGDPDERPVHPRRLGAFWISDVPITWAAYCDLSGWSAPPAGWPPDDDPTFVAAAGDTMSGFMLNELNKIRLQYCETETEAAGDWHAHTGDARFGRPPRTNAARPYAFDQKPIVAVSAAEAEELAHRMSDVSTLYRLPFEAEWEKAARGGRVGRRWSWGDEPPTHERCDFDRFGAFHLVAPRALPSNGYGLFGMCGGVAEWTADRYDALAYERASRGEKLETPEPSDPRVLRGGSWGDCAEAVTVSFRTSRVSASWRSGERGSRAAPNIGFRLVRVPRHR
jgi:formylglycine-generating enzyme